MNHVYSDGVLAAIKGPTQPDGIVASHAFKAVRNMCVDMCIDMCVDMCIDMRVDMCIDMRIDMCIDMC